EYCSSLRSVTIPSSVTSIGESAFEYCSSLRSVTIPSSVTSIESRVFENCSSLSSVTIPSSVTSIGANAFSNCSSLNSVTIPSSVTSIRDGAFSGCSSLSSVTIPSSVTWIGAAVFANCSSLSSVTIPSSVTSIEFYAFVNCSSLSSVTIPSSVTSIVWSAFEGCSSLSSITIPSSVTSIGYEAFEGCSSLSSITILSSVTSIEDDVFSDCSSKLVIYGYAGSTAESYAKSHNIKFQILGHTHTYGKYTVTKKPTCTELGTKKKVCTTCSAEVTESIPATGHTWNSGKITKAATASATGIKTYTCTVCKATKTEIIPKKTLVNNTITASNITRTYSAKAQTFYLNVKRKGSGKITYSSNDKSITVNSVGKVTVKAKYVGKATITIKVAEDGTYKAAAKKITITVNKLANVITASNITRTYSAKAQTFSIGAKRKGTGKLTYSSNNSKVAVNSSGKITVKAKFIGKATITIKVAASSVYKAAAKKITVTVNPTKTALSSISNVKGKKITVKWKKNTAGTGYQIQYSTSKTFASGNKTVNVAKNSAASKTITGLSKGKTYYVRIRTYKTVSGKKYYSGWSAAKSVKINK
ncbi:MAG: leucine-rich repeat protein, partial [Eubacteriales bacterium]|nr:leucine-rich repeat protein [Eubacteriales bacterium]